MATYNELFPHGDPELKEPFSPINPRALRGAGGAMGAATRRAISLGEGAEGASQGIEDILAKLREEAPLRQTLGGDVTAGDYGRAFSAGVGGLGVAGAGALEYGAEQMDAPTLAGIFRQGREAATDFTQSQVEAMSPEAQARMTRQWTTLDPNQTIWQGGAGEFVSSLALKLTQAAPSLGVTLIPGALMLRAGLGAGALTYLGASEGALSLGGIAANIAQEIEDAPEEELLKSPRYAELRQQMDETEARRQFIPEAQGYAPVIGGLVVGSISALTGKYLQPIFSDAPRGVLGRFATGFGSEGTQESSQGASEQIAQNVAAQVYDSTRTPFTGVGEAAVEGLMVGGPLGGGTTALLGARPRTAIPPRPVPGAEAPVAGGMPPPAPTPAAPPPQVDPAIAAAVKAQTRGPFPMLEAPEQMGYPRLPAPPRGFTMEPTQGLLPLRDDQAGGGPISPEPAQPYAPDMSQPEGFGRMVRAAVPPEATVSDQLKARAKKKRGRPKKAEPTFELPQEAMEELAVDESQLDMFQPQPGLPSRTTVSERPMTGFERGTRAITGFEVVLQDAQGTPVDSTTYATAEEANAAAKVLSDDLVLGRGLAAAVPDGKVFVQRVREPSPYDLQERSTRVSPDEPSAEPVSDLMAQAEELGDPDTQRRGIYLASANIESLRANGQLDRIRAAGVPLANFDGKGGALIAKNRQAAEELIDMRDQGIPMQEVLGYATGAGAGKPRGASIVVQQRDTEGNVTRESLVASEEEADKLAADWDQEPDRESVILSSKAAIRRRAQKIREENVGFAAQKERRATAPAVERAVGQTYRTPKELADFRKRPESFPEPVERAVEKASKAPTRGEAAQRLARSAVQQYSEEQQRKQDYHLRPKDLTFEDPNVEADYRAAYSDYITAAIKAEEARLPAEPAPKPKKVVQPDETYRPAEIYRRDEERAVEEREEEPAHEEAETESAEQAEERAERLKGAEREMARLSDRLISLRAIHKPKRSSEKLMRAATTLDKRAVEEAAAKREKRTGLIEDEDLLRLSAFTPLTDEEIEALDELDLTAESIKAYYMLSSMRRDPVERTSYTVEAKTPDGGTRLIRIEDVEALQRELRGVSLPRKPPPEGSTAEEIPFNITLEEFLKQVSKPSLKQRLLQRLSHKLRAIDQGGKSRSEPIARAASYTRVETELEGVLLPDKAVFPNSSIEAIYRDAFQKYSAAVTKLTAKSTTPAERPALQKFVRSSRQELLALINEESIGRKGLRSTEFVKEEAVYDTDVLTQGMESQKEREMSVAERAKRKGRAEVIYGSLREELAKMRQFFSKMQIGPFRAVADQRDALGVPTAEAQDMIYGKAYARALYEFALAVEKTGYDSGRTLKTIEKLVEDFRALREMTPQKFARFTSALMRVESKKNVKRAIKEREVEDEEWSPQLDKKTRGLPAMQVLRTAEGRAAATARSLEELRKHLAFQIRAEVLWKDNADYRNHIAPLMRKFAESVQTSGWLSYRPTEDEVSRLAAVIDSMRRRGDTARVQVRQSVSKVLKSYGFELDPKRTVVKQGDAPDTGWTAAKIHKLITDILGARTGYETVTPQYRQEIRQLGFTVDNNGRILVTPESRRFRWDGANAARLARKLTAIRLAGAEELPNSLQTTLEFMGFDFNKDGKIVIPRDENGKFAWESERALTTKFSKQFGPLHARTDADAVETIDLPSDERSAQEIYRDFKKGIDEQKATLDNPSVTRAGAERIARILAANKAIEDFRAVVNSPKAKDTDLIAAEEQLIDFLKKADLWTQKSNVLGRINAPAGKTVRLVGRRLQKGNLTFAEAKEAALNAYQPIPVSEESQESPYFQKMSKPRYYGLRGIQARSYKKSTFERLRRLSREQQTLSDTSERAQREADAKKDALDLITPTSLRHSEAIKQAGQAAAEAMANVEEVASINDLLVALQGNLPSSSNLYTLARRLYNLNMRVNVMWAGAEIFDGKRSARTASGTTVIHNGKYMIFLNRDKFDAVRMLGENPEALMVHTVLHEAVHAATAGAISENATVARYFEELRDIVARELEARGEGSHYGLTDAHEFVAEAFSNADFQDLLHTIQVDRSRTVWQSIIHALRTLLGLATGRTYTASGQATDEANLGGIVSALDAVLTTSDIIFTGKPAKNFDLRFNLDDAAVPQFKHIFSKLDQTARARRAIYDSANVAGQAANKFLLGALTMEQLKIFFRKHFRADGQDALGSYINAFSERNAENSRLMERADKLSRRWTEATEEDTANAVEMSRLMTEATLHSSFIDRPVTDESNKHLKRDIQKTRHAELNRRWEQLPDNFKELYRAVQKYYSDTLTEEIGLMTLNALRGVALEGPNPAMTLAEFEKLTVDDVWTLKLNTIKGLEARFGEALNESERRLIAKIGNLPGKRSGPYFPLLRDGDFVVYAQRKMESKEFATFKEARTFAGDLLAGDPTLETSTKKLDDGTYRVDVLEKELRIAETFSEAKQHEQEMIATYGQATTVDGDGTRPVQLRAQLFTSTPAIGTGQALNTILGKLAGNRAAQAAVKNAYLRSLADSSFRKREIHRTNRKGFDYERQHRNFAQYAKSSSYYISQLKFGWRMAKALNQMQQMAKEHRDESEITSVRMGEIVREIDTRDEQMTDPVEVTDLVRKGSELSHFLLLSTPSYWIINATQPYMVTLPWLGARFGLNASRKALANAQRLIASPLLKQTVDSVAGLKAIISKTASEKAFSVLEQVEEHIKKEAGDRAPQYLNMLKELKRHSIIDLSLVAELRDIAQGLDQSNIRRVMDASRIMSHLTEVNNRIITALASYELALDKGFADQDAIDFAKQAVSLTQFNYSSGNKPRLFGVKGLFGQYSPLAFQFMQYPQHMYALFTMEVLRLVKTKGMSRQIAAKTLAGLFTTHLAAAGILGAAMQPLKWAIGLAIAGLNDEDDRVKDILSGDTFDQNMREVASDLFGPDLGLLLSKGIPASLGADLSQRMSFGTLYYMDLDTKNANSFIGSLATTFGGPLVNIGASAFQGAKYLQTEQYEKALESVAPKGVKDAVRFMRYAGEGLTSASGTQLIGANDMKPMELFLQSIGFQPTRINEYYAGKQVADNDLEAQKEQKARLMTMFRLAESPEDRQKVIKKISEFSKEYPQARITRSDLIRSRRRERETTTRIRRFGVDAGRRSREFRERLSPYRTFE